MSSFSKRLGVGQKSPSRTNREVAPEEVRAELIQLLWDRQERSEGEFQAYRDLCRMLRKVPDSSIWGENELREVDSLVNQMAWNQVYDVIEEVLDGSGGSRFNEVFARTGVAYEVMDGTVYPWEPVADELEVSSVAYDALATSDPTGRFKSAMAQYAKAVAFLDGRPPDLEKAVSEAVNAIEAVVRIISGERSINAGLQRLMPSGERKCLRDSINQLFNYASAVPGARHGAHAPSGLIDAEARYVVRVAGSAIAFLITADTDGGLPLR
ncbi:MAG TPA: hypothetical protein VGY76_10820 [Solirubrobacteraceae bacterium]|jgi:hypothetical protein|nr:hypothetical protein [Solirubrobacteraceae bacterium]